MAIEETLRLWAKSPSASEREKCDNAVSVVKSAISNSEELSKKSIQVFAQGSYRNHTNVRKDSDVDVCVLCTDTCYFHLPDGRTKEEFGLNSPATYLDNDFRNDVQKALVNRFGLSNVYPGNKAWNLKENTNRVTADVVACFEYRFYFDDGDFRQGTAVLPKSGNYICNYPEQNYANVKVKNEETNQRFRACVRILKNLNNELIDKHNDFSGLPSFLIESLVWNVPIDGFGHELFQSDTRWILATLCNDTTADNSCSEWLEANGCKYLFHELQQWTRGGVNTALNSYWKFLNFD